MTDQEAPNESPSTAPAHRKSLQGRLPSASENLLAEYSNQIFFKSVVTSLDFHKTMLGISATFGSSITTLVPILIFDDKDAKIPADAGWLLLVPALLMLVSSVCFAFGYYPRYKNLYINDIKEIQKDRNSLLMQRACLASIGLLLFCASLLILTGLSVYLRPTA